MDSFPITQLTEGEWTSPRCVEVLGVKLPAYFTPNPVVLAEFMSSFETRPDDVLVVTYRKSGTSYKSNQSRLRVACEYSGEAAVFAG